MKSLVQKYDFDFCNPKFVLQALIKLFPNQLIWGTDSPASFLTNFQDNAISLFSEHLTYEADIQLLMSMPKKDIELISNINTVRFLFG